MDENLKKVSFIEMKKGTKADYELLTKYEHEFVSGLPDRILQELKNTIIIKTIYFLIS